MAQNPLDMIEWHLLENPAAASAAGHSPLHIGPFSTEEECHSLLTILNRFPGFRHTALEIQQRHRRREKRIQIKLPVQVGRLSVRDQLWSAHTVDISTLGARLTGLAEPLKVGEVLEIHCGRREAIFRVMWIGPPNTGAAGHVGVECLTPETNIWDLDMSARTDDEPLLQEIAIARAVQRNLFPRHKPPLRTLDYAADCIQAHTVGGDYYDFLDLASGRVGFVLADVAGKGVAAALLMANLQGTIHNASANLENLPELLASVNEHFYQHTDPDRYATLFFGCYDDQTRSLAYVNCGHNPPLLLRANGAVERLSATATVLGLFTSWKCSLAQTHLDPGDILSIFTDGILETTGATAEEFGEARLVGIVRESRNLEATAILQQVEQALEHYRAGEYLQDDLTLVVARAR